VTRRTEPAQTDAGASATSTRTAEPPSPAPPPAVAPLRTRLATANVFWIFLVLLALVVFFSTVEPNFANPVNVRSIAADNAALLVLAVGMTFVIITAGIDLSVGSVLIFSGVVAAKVMLALGGDPQDPSAGASEAGWAVILAGLGAGLLAGLGWGIVNGLLVTKARVPPLIATLGTLGMALGMSYLITGGTDVRGVPQELARTIGFGQLLGTIPWLVVIAAAVAGLLGLVLAYTRFGRHTYAIGSNPEAARRVGIKVDRHLVKVYALMGLLAGLAGCMSLAHFSTTTISGHSADNLAAIAAVVLGGTSLFGGTGKVAGTVIGVLIPAVLQSGFVTIGVNPYWQNFAVGAVLVAAVYFDQVRRRTRERTSR
jgi:ribose transport system permease protein